MILRITLLFLALFATAYPAEEPKMSVAAAQSEFQSFKKQYPEDHSSFESFAAQMDSLQKVDSRFEIYKGKPELYPIMPIEWVEAAYRKAKKTSRNLKVTIAEFGWSADCEEGGARYREAYRDHFASLVILYGFLGTDKMPVSDVYVVEKSPSYIRFISKSGQTITHSGRYSVIE